MVSSYGTREFPDILYDLILVNETWNNPQNMPITRPCLRSSPKINGSPEKPYDLLLWKVKIKVLGRFTPIKSTYSLSLRKISHPT